MYVVGLEENLFPSQMALNNRSDLEEERRLFYVAITRAEKKATLSYALTRYRFGNILYCEHSRFIEEIDADFVELPEAPQETEFGEDTFAAFRNQFNETPKKDMKFNKDNKYNKSAGSASPTPKPGINFQPAKKLVSLNSRLMNNPAPRTSPP